MRCGGCKGEGNEGSKEARQEAAVTVLVGDGAWVGKGGSRMNLLAARYRIKSVSL